MKNIFTVRYDEMRLYYANDDHPSSYFMKEIEAKHFKFAEELQNQEHYCDIGIDLPCWINKSDHVFAENSYSDVDLQNLKNKTVMLIGQDSMRDGFKKPNLY